jgi:3-isopropylmalate/(R)-2-methylmalate dehydratase small subunit
MKPFTTHTGTVAPLDRSDVDTDQLVPKQFLKRVERTGFGQFLFFDWRYKEDGTTPNPDFMLNQPAYQKATILLSRRNFGCGSSREHAPLALLGSQISCVIAKSFARIFFRNAINVGLPLVECAEADRILEGDILEIDISGGLVKNMTQNEEYKTTPLPDFLIQIIEDGGLVKHTQKNL